MVEVQLRAIKLLGVLAGFLLVTPAFAQNVIPHNESTSATTPVNGCMYFDQGTTGGTDTKLCAPNAAGWATAFGFGPLSTIASISAALDTIGSTQGGILYRGSSAWSYLAPGTSGFFLETLGAGANPVWAAGGGGGGGTGSAPQSAYFSATNVVTGNTNVSYQSGYSLFNYTGVAMPTPLTGSVMQVGGLTTPARIELDGWGASTGVGPVFTTQFARGTPGSPTATQSGDVIGSYSALGYGATSYATTNRGGVRVVATENWTDAAQGTETDLDNTTTGTTTLTHTLRVSGNGAVLGAPTGGFQGPNTLNMQGCYINGVACASGSSVAFGTITSGTNAAAAMLVGTGASLGVSGSGTIGATTLNGATFASPGTIGSTTPSTGAFTTLSASSSFTATGLVTLADLATQTANTVLANVSASTASPTAAALPSCVDTAGNHLNYTNGTGFSCGSTSASGTQSIGTFGGSANVYTMASPTPAVSSNTAYYRVCGFFPAALANTGASTLAVGTAAALPIRRQSQAGLLALSGGEITGSIQSQCFGVDSTASFWVMDSLGSTIAYNPGTYTVTSADFANGKAFVSTSGTNALTLAASTTYSSSGGAILLMGGGQPMTIAPNGTDTINGVNATFTLASYDLGIMTTTASGAFTIAKAGGKSATISWLPGMNLSSPSTGFTMNTQLSTPMVIYGVECRVDVAVGATATINLYYAASGTAYSSGTLITTTACNANGTANTSQTGLLSAPVTVPASDSIGIVATGFTSASLGAGNIQFRY